MNLSTVQKQLFAWGMGHVNDLDMTQIKLKNCPPFANLAELKQSLLAQAKGIVVEIGPGAGAGFSYYSPDIQWIGVEPNIFMHHYLEAEAEKQGFHQIKLCQGSAEQLPLEDNSVDCVVSTHVLCSVQDISQCFREVERVLKPGGEFIFLEHVVGDRHSWTNRLQRVVNPLWKTLFDNCHLTRNTGDFLAETGLEVMQYYPFQVTLPLVSPHIAGIARKGESLG